MQDRVECAQGYLYLGHHVVSPVADEHSRCYIHTDFGLVGSAGNELLSEMRHTAGTVVGIKTIEASDLPRFALMIVFDLGAPGDVLRKTAKSFMANLQKDLDDSNARATRAREVSNEIDPILAALAVDSEYPRN